MRLELRLARYVESHVLAVGVLGVHLESEVSGAGRRQAALLVEQVEDAHTLGLEHVNAVLVVDEGDAAQAEALALIERLLVLEYALVEELLELLVAVVDAELLVRVDGKVLEAGDVEQADEAGRGGERNGAIHARHDVVEELGVERLGEGVASTLRLAHLQRHHDHRAELAAAVCLHDAAGEA